MSRRTRAGVGGLFWLTVGLLRLSMGQGGLVSLSPESLDYVVQDEVTLLWGQWSVYRSTPVKRDNAMLAYLSQEGIVAAIPARTGRLELIEYWNPSWRDGHGVLRRLFLHDRQEVVEWSKANPAVARRYWREGFRGLRSADRKEICLGQQVLLTCRDCETVQELDDRIAALRKEIDEMYR